MKGDDEAVIAEEVQKVNSQFYDAFESLSIERMERLWKHEDNIGCIHPGWELFTGWLAVRESCSTIFDNTDMIRFTITNTKVRVFINNGKIAAVVVCLENIETSVNRQNVKLGVIATNIFEKNENQQWLLIHHHGSSLSNYISHNVYS